MEQCIDSYAYKWKQASFKYLNFTLWNKQNRNKMKQTENLQRFIKFNTQFTYIPDVGNQTKLI